MEVETVVEERNPSSNGAPEQNPGSNVQDHRDGLKQEKEEKEGLFLLGSPSFEELDSGRFRCLETGHELPAIERVSYARSKACRLSLIDAAISNKRPPLNMFQPHPLSKSKLVCELTGDTVNKSEEHIWKHISGKRFQNKLEEKEIEKMSSKEKLMVDKKQAQKLSKSKVVASKKDQNQEAESNCSLGKKIEEPDDNSDEPNFWVPSIGNRWDYDNGRDRWESCETSGCKTNGELGSEVDEKDDSDSAELSMRTKRMSIAVGPSSFASTKKKTKKTATLDN